MTENGGSIGSGSVTVTFGTGPAYDVVNPATGVPLATVQSTAASDLYDAIAAAAAAQARWATTDLRQRLRLLRESADGIRARAEELALLLTTEQGKPLKEAAIEVNRCADTFEYYAAEAEPALARTTRSLVGKAAWVVKRPVGVIAAIVPWNFPLTLLANKLVPALAAGNAVVVKPAPTTPLATHALLDILREVGIPPELTPCAVGGNDIGAALTTDPHVGMISFTGSTATGRAIMAAVAPTVTRTVLELGGSDPLIVCDDADLEAAARATAVGRFFNCGQACVAVKRVFVMDDVYEEFLEKIVARAERLELGDGTRPGVRLGPQHSEVERQKSVGMIADAVERGAKVVTGGTVPDTPELKAGYFLAPAILTDVSPEAVIMNEECFGPVLPVTRVQSFDEALAAANRTIYGLGSSVFTTSAHRAEEAVARLDAGYTWINDIATDYDVLPFGGVKQSGFGRERGLEGLDEYVSLKSVVAGNVPEGFCAG